MLFKNKSVSPCVYNGFTLLINPSRSNRRPFGAELQSDFSSRSPKLRSSGFTLAETLITLVIVGVIAAITVPSLIAKYQEEQFKSQFKKCYSMLANAINAVIFDNGSLLMPQYDNSSPPTITKAYGQLFAEKFSTIKTCENTSDCLNKKVWHQNYEWYDSNGNSLAQNVGGMYYMSGFIAADGSLWRFYFFDSTCNYGSYKICGYVAFDTNGFKGPNKYGKDLYSVRVNKNGKIIADDYVNKILRNQPD